MKEKPLCGYATVHTTKTKSYFLFLIMKTSLFTFHVYKNLLKNLNW